MLLGNKLPLRLYLTIGNDNLVKDAFAYTAAAKSLTSQLSRLQYENQWRGHVPRATPCYVVQHRADVTSSGISTARYI